MSLSSNFPTSKPSLNLDFANVGALDPRITFTRSSSATYTNSLGLITTAATNVARFDYDPTTLAARGLLVEEQRTNLYTYSEQFDNAAWTTSNCTVTANAATAPDGTNSADRAVFTANGLLYQNLVPNAAGTYTITAWVRSATGSNQTIRVFGNGTLTLSSNITVTTSWQRIEYTYTYSSATSGFTTASGGTADVFIWGAQVEAGSFATSYIPTVASTVTRSADVASVNTLSPWFNNTESTVFIEASTQAPPATTNAVGFSFNAGSIERTNVFVAGGSSLGAARSWLFVYNSGSTIVDLQSAATAVTQNATTKLAAVIKTNDFALVANGGTVLTDTSGAPVTPTTLQLGVDWNNATSLNGHLRRVAYYPVRLTNAQLQALTS